MSDFFKQLEGLRNFIGALDQISEMEKLLRSPEEQKRLDEKNRIKDGAEWCSAHMIELTVDGRSYTALVHPTKARPKSWAIQATDDGIIIYPCKSVTKSAFIKNLNENFHLVRQVISNYKRDHGKEVPRLPGPSFIDGTAFLSKSPETCTIDLNGKMYAYTLNWSTRRINFSLSVTPSGEIICKAPVEKSIESCEAFIRENAQWLLTQLANISRQQDSTEVVAVKQNLQNWFETREIKVFGNRSIKIEVNLSKYVEWDADAGSVRVGVCHEAFLNNRENIRLGLIQSLKGLAEVLLQSRLIDAYKKIGKTKRALTGFKISTAKQRWGCCNGRGKIMLNWRLLFVDEQAVDYVIYHELAHLNELNHSPQFWATVAQYMPDYQQAQERLKQLTLSEIEPQ